MGGRPAHLEVGDTRLTDPDADDVRNRTFADDVRNRTFATGPRSVHTGSFGVIPSNNPYQGGNMLLILAAVLLIIAIAGGVIIHPILFAIAILAIIVFFIGRRGAVR